MCEVPPEHDGPKPPPGESLCGSRLALELWRVLTGYWPDIDTTPIGGGFLRVPPGTPLPAGYEVPWQDDWPPQ